MGVGSRGDLKRMTAVVKRESMANHLPNILGVEKLSKAEVNQDLNEIQNLGYNSDSSVDSSEIAPSSYPVKPRKEPKFVSPELLSRYRNLHVEKEEVPVAEIIEFLSLIEYVRPDLRDAERERENYEVTYQAIRDAFIADSQRINTTKKQQEWYIRTVQGILARNLSLYSSYSHHATILHGLLEAIREKNAAQEAVHKASTALADLKEAVENSKDARIEVPQETDALAVTTADGRVALFRKGVQVFTPYGSGTILTIRPAQKIVVLALPYAVVYSSVSEVLQWYSHTNDSFGASRGYSSYMAERWQRSTSQLHLSADIQDSILKDGPLLDALAKQEKVRQRKDRHAVSDAALNGDNDSDSDACLDISSEMDVDDNEEKPTDELEAEFEIKEELSRQGIIDRDSQAEIESSIPYTFAPIELFVPLSEHMSASQKKRVLSTAYCDNANMKKIERLKKRLNVLVTNISDLNREKIDYMRKIERMGAQGARLSQSSSATRLNMFTRRVRRRNLIIESDSPTWKGIANGASMIDNEVILSAAPSGRDSLPNAASPVNAATASSVSKSRPQKGGVQVGGSHSVEGITMEESNAASNGSRNAPKRKSGAVETVETADNMPMASQSSEVSNEPDIGVIEKKKPTKRTRRW